SSALFSLSKYRNFALSTFLIVSDVLKTSEWDPKFSSQTIKQSMDQLNLFFTQNLDQLIQFER
ncbi:hypothetical protein MJH12_09155, partial [bacterium]|nr:hypothetical protein [bacterium]